MTVEDLVNGMIYISNEAECKDMELYDSEEFWNSITINPVKMPTYNGSQFR